MISQAQAALTNHRDPFDRMLVAQSLMENMRMVTPDVVFDQHGVKRIW
jgi:PIN domain nuclease of toxin-antitoxin system